MAGLVGVSQIVTRLRSGVTNSIIEPVGGSNPADLAAVRITNVRGQVAYEIISGDNSYTSSFSMEGGFGSGPNDYTRNFNLVPFSARNCVVNELANNLIEVITPVADAGGRRYVLQFFVPFSFGPTINQTTVNVLGNNTLTVRMSKVFIGPEGF